MITHPDYNPEGVLNDIALLRLDRDLDLETYGKQMKRIS